MTTADVRDEPEPEPEPEPDDAEPDEPEAELDEPEPDAPEPDGHEQAMSWYLQRWRDIQTDFVDTPREAVALADSLVADLIEQLTTALTSERDKLAAQWSDDATPTEDLRVAFQGYRAFFERLVAT